MKSEELVETFVDVGPLFSLLSSQDHQVIYGRRGTGKTHCLKFLAERVKQEGQAAVLLDMRTTGSTGGTLTDSDLPLNERGTRLLADCLGAIHTALYEFGLRQANGLGQGSSFMTVLNALADEIVNVRVVGSVEREASSSSSRSAETTSSAGISAGTNGVEGSIGSGTAETSQEESTGRIQESGILRHTIHFGAVGKQLQALVSDLPDGKLWIVIDEWSVVPVELQPLLADWLRRCLFPIRGVTVKIATIERRSSFSVQGDAGDYIGIELGADTSAVLDLDDFMVFENDEAQAVRFFGELLRKHVNAMMITEGLDPIDSADEFVGEAFDNSTETFGEFVRAAEGVPRDAIHIASLCAQSANDQTIDLATVRRAARRWYQRDKESALTYQRARDLLHWIIDKVLTEQRGAVFLLEERSASAHPLVELLYDARVLHVLKKGVSASDKLGERFDVYGLDFGCYVDFLASSEQPANTPGENGVERLTVEQVSLDEYEPTPEKILDLSDFEGVEP
ncbi:MAG: hypothetical protein ACRDI3_05830 [Actinomycetota bacterium]